MITYIESDLSSKEIIKEYENLWLEFVNEENKLIKNNVKTNSTPKNFIKKLKYNIKSSKKIKAFFIKDDDDFVGMVIALITKDGDARLHDLYLKKEYRQKGVGSKLIENAIEWLLKNNATNIYLNVVAGNEKVLPFYKKHKLEVSRYILKYKK